MKEVDWAALEQRVLAGLVPFQRRTVEWAFANLFGSADDVSSGRFLVADEVGLGKTMVARGVVAKSLRHLAQSAERADVVYVCSNAGIAQQNLARLDINVPGSVFEGQGRLTLLPLRRKSVSADGLCAEASSRAGGGALRETGVNFLSLTPGTSFDVAGGTGHSRERALICWMLSRDLGGRQRYRLLKLFASRTSLERFRNQLLKLETEWTVDPVLERQFHERLSQPWSEGLSLREGVNALADRINERKLSAADRSADRRKAVKLIGALRAELARVCIESVRPALVILDEFQRFSDLFRPDNEVGELARRLTQAAPNGQRTRVLLLSATPYRMYSAREGAGDSAAYEQFLETVDFLMDHDAGRLKALREDLEMFNRLLRAPGAGPSPSLHETRDRIQRRLSRHIARTDRVPTSRERDAMVVVPDKPVTPTADDLVAHASLKRVADLLGETGLTEYWRSAAYPLSFLGGYALHEKLKDELKAGQLGPRLTEALRAPGLFLPATDRESGLSASESPANSRARALAAELVEAGIHRLLWIPPALPAYPLSGAYARLGDAARTKRLVFSSWRMVPRSLSTVVDAMLLRSLTELAGPLPSRHHDWEPMDFLLLYPGTVLAGEFPLSSREGPDSNEPPSFERLTDQVANRLLSRLEHLVERYGDRSTKEVDGRWYWMAALLLDHLHGDSVLSMPALRRLLDHWDRRLELRPSDSEHGTSEGRDELDADGSAQTSGNPARELPGESAEKVAAGGAGDAAEEIGGEESLGPGEAATVMARPASDAQAKVIIELFERTIAGDRLGGMPPDLAQVLAQVAVAAPGVCALRSLAGSRQEFSAPALQHAAFRIGTSVWTYLGSEPAQAVLSLAGGEATFWRRALAYCGHGCFQSVLDEYVAVLSMDKPSLFKQEQPLEEVAQAMRDVLRLRPAVLRPEVFSDGELRPISRTLRHCRPLLEEKHRDDDNGGRGASDGDARSSMNQLRDAFNSPFLPFVLSSTSIGQEGLDFHWYCHAIVHWNLPGNPVDFEQRDGRIHRFRNHAVRRNVAQDWGAALVSGAGVEVGKEGPPQGGWAIWCRLFEKADLALARMSGQMEGLSPSWVYRPGDGGEVGARPAWLVQHQGSKAMIERHVPTIPLSRDVRQKAELTRAVGRYRVVFAQPRQDDLLAHLAAMSGRSGTGDGDLSGDDSLARLAIDLRPPAR